ncbi:MarR family transcriptional regulator [Desulfopila sp. IMCC35006]|uniref:MarR family winged helix-turn-helix transcriptional regulator n=1 Tax=Desulfopila sp. IMCC35006 TaxID=2569542 RepID=UPI0010AC0C3A|nr:MarR family transcriptional regulator [Desulfopila sp. IMCC35006]TKB25551.1 MarR family transcriptional regulator [Desulfopila sp. IMCC35006]
METAGEASFWRLIGVTARAMRSYADQRLKSYDLTVEQLQVMKQADLCDGLPQRELSALTGKSPANMTRILDRLEKKNRIIRKLNPEDRRSILVFLTKEGKALKDEVINLFDNLRVELVQGIDDDKQQAAAEVLKAIRNNIEKMSER